VASVVELSPLLESSLPLESTPVVSSVPLELVVTPLEPSLLLSVAVTLVTVGAVSLSLVSLLEAVGDVTVADVSSSADVDVSSSVPVVPSSSPQAAVEPMIAIASARTWESVQVMREA
jgi:hypothetical protein